MTSGNTEKKKLDKAKRGWWFSVMFLLVIVGLVAFLSKHEIVSDNKDILVGILGVLTGSISSMMAIASGRDPAEVDELKDKLSAANADRAALISRLRDAQIQLELRTQQICELQEAVIEKLSMFAGDDVIKTKDPQEVILPPQVEEWLPVDRDSKAGS
tara:strand:- start:125 stop:598 length:474 start_codon:yes stop_codon:yes gene_type:complete